MSDAEASTRKKATTRTQRRALATSCGMLRVAPSTATTIVRMANPNANMSEMLPRSEKCTMNPYSLWSRHSGCELRRAFSEQRLRLKWSVTRVVTLYYDLDAGRKDIGHDAAVDDRQRLPIGVGDHKADLRAVMHDCSFLHRSGNAYRLRGTDGAVVQLRDGHIIHGIGLRIGINKVDHRP